MTEQYQDGTESGYGASRSLRRVNEPLFTGLDVAAFVVTLVMVCGPLAFGAFGL